MIRCPNCNYGIADASAMGYQNKQLKAEVERLQGLVRSFGGCLKCGVKVCTVNGERFCGCKK